MNRKHEVILQLLSTERRWWYGLQLIEASEGCLKRGYIYLDLFALEDEDWVESCEETDEEFQPVYPDQQKRRRYRITERGIRELEEWQLRSANALPELA